MKTPHEKYDDALIISRLQQIELSSLKPSSNVDSPFFHLLTVASQKPFFHNLPLNLGIEFHLIGSKILGITIDRGYFAHDLEATLATLPPADAIKAIARLNLSAPIFYQAALLAAYTKIADKSFSLESARPLTIAMEFARVGHHLVVIQNVLNCLQLTRLAEIAKDCSEILRAPCQLYSRIRTPTDAEANSISHAEIGDILSDASARAEELLAEIGAEERIRKALQKKAVISISQAGSLGLTGIYLRANQDLYDLRRQSSYSFPYQKPPRIAVGEGGDMLTRFVLRLSESLASLRWLKQVLLEGNSTTANLQAIVFDPLPISGQPMRPYAYGEVESPEGNAKVSIFANTENKAFFRIRTPAYFIAQAIPQLLLHHDLNDVAMLLFSLGITADEIDV